MTDFGKLNFSISFNPTSAFPLDSRYYFESLSDAEQAASKAVEVGSTNGTYFIGETLVVVEYSPSRIPTSVNLYVINKNKELEKVILNSDMIARLAEVSQAMSVLSTSFNKKLDNLESEVYKEFDATSDEIYLGDFIVSAPMFFSIDDNTGSMIPDENGLYLLTINDKYEIIFDRRIVQNDLDGLGSELRSTISDEIIAGDNTVRSELAESEERSNEKINILRSDIDSEFENTSNEIYLGSKILNGTMVFGINNDSGAMEPDENGMYLLTVDSNYKILFDRKIVQSDLDNLESNLQEDIASGDNLVREEIAKNLSDLEERTDNKISVTKSDVDAEFEKTSNEIYLNNFIVNGMMVFGINENGAMVPDVDGPYLLTVTEDYGIFFKYLTEFVLDPTVGALAINY